MRMHDKVMGKAGKHQKLGHIAGYNGGYDAYYCSTCNIWLEGQCGDKKCLFCKNRPKTPNERGIKFKRDMDKEDETKN